VAHLGWLAEKDEQYGVGKFCEICADRSRCARSRNRDQSGDWQWVRGAEFFNPGFYLLLAEYGIFHAVALSVARILSMIFSVRVRSVLYLSVSIVGFWASIYLLNPSKYGGVHLFIICWGSLVLIALDYIWRANVRHQSERLSSS